jgi:hypothetical protein
VRKPGVGIIVIRSGRWRLAASPARGDACCTSGPQVTLVASQQIEHHEAGRPGDGQPTSPRYSGMQPLLERGEVEVPVIPHHELTRTASGSAQTPSHGSRRKLISRDSDHRTQRALDAA